MVSRTAAALLLLSASFAGQVAAAEPVPRTDPFAPLASKLISLQAGRQGKVRVLHFGDSHVASSPEPMALGQLLKGIFGDGGPGLCLPWTPPRYTVRAGLRTGCSGGWRRVVPRGDSLEDDAGLVGCYLECDTPGESAWVEGQGSSFRLEFLQRPGGGTAQVFLDGKPVGHVNAASERRGVGVFDYEAAPAGGATHRWEIRSGGGPFRILGAALENPSGLVYSPLGILGARADLLLKCRPETFDTLMLAESPDLILVAFGTNESGSRPGDLDAYPALFTRVLRRLRSAAPDAALVVLGPPDRTGAAQGMDRTIAAQRGACSAEGAAFLDQRQAMGGPGTFARWAASRPALAQPDGVHFTADGYLRLARDAASALLARYDKTKAEAPFQAALLERWGDGARPLLALASRPTALPVGGLELRLPASWSEEASRAAAEPSHEVYYFRNAEGVLVITDDPSYGASQPPPHTGKGKSSPVEGQPYYYFQQEDGSLIITSDRDSVKGKAGRFLTPEEVSARPAGGRDPGAAPGR
jgi:lysophospholipase L1-like esterase